VDFRELEIAQALDRTVPHSIRIAIDFVPGESNDVVKVYVDDQLRMTGSSWENYYRHDAQAGPANTVPVIDQLLLRVSSTAQPALQGKGFLVDDVSSRSYGGEGGPAGPAGPAGAPGLNAAIAPNGLTGAQGQTGASATNTLTPIAAPVGVQIRSARLNRRTGLATIRLRCPAGAGLCSGNASLLNGRGTRVRRMYDLSSLQFATLRIRFATRGRTATVHKRTSVKLAVFSRDKSGQAVRVQRTLR
jgi:hypothetical protein